MLGMFVHEFPHDMYIKYLVADDIVEECSVVYFFEFFVCAFVDSNNFVEGDSFGSFGHVCAELGCGSLECVICSWGMDTPNIFVHRMGSQQGVTRSRVGSQQGVTRSRVSLACEHIP